MSVLRSRRNSAVELLRILFSIGICVLHYNNVVIGGAFLYAEDDSVNQKYLLFSESFFIAAVNVFIMISGFYSAKALRTRILKIPELLIQTSLFALMFYLADVLTGSDQWSLRQALVHLLPNHYFVILYSALSLTAPFLNAGLREIRRHGRSLRALTVLLLILFSAEPFLVDVFDRFTAGSYSVLSTIGREGSQDGYTIVNFMLVYILGASMNLLEIRISRKLCAAGSLAGILLLWILSLQNSVVWHYENPLIILISALLVSFATQSSFSSRAVNELSGACFTCFLFHAWFFRFLRIDLAVRGSLFGLIAHQLVTCTLLFLLSFAAWKLWSLLWRGAVRVFRLEPACRKAEKMLYGGLRDE